MACLPFENRWTGSEARENFEIAKSWEHTTHVLCIYKYIYAVDSIYVSKHIKVQNRGKKYFDWILTGHWQDDHRLTTIKSCAISTVLITGLKEGIILLFYCSGGLVCSIWNSSEHLLMMLMNRCFKQIVWILGFFSLSLSSVLLPFNSLQFCCRLTNFFEGRVSKFTCFSTLSHTKLI